MLQPHLFRDMALFVEVAKRGSFSQAAAALDMPISSLSRRISLFEAALGLRLIERTTRRFVLTRHGETYLLRAARLVEDAQRALDDLLAEARAPRTVFRIALPSDAWAMTVVSGTIPSMDWPERLHLHIEDVSASASDCDLAVLAGAPQATSPSLLHLVVEAPNGLCAAQAYLARHGIPDMPQDLKAHRVILPTSDAHGRWVLRRADEAVAVQVVGNVSAGTADIARRLALDGHGIASVSLAEIEREKRLIPVLPDWRLPPTPIHILLSPRPLAPEARRLIDGVTTSIGSYFAEGKPSPASASRDA